MTISELYALVGQEKIFEFYGLPVVKHKFKNPLTSHNKETCQFYYSRKTNVLFYKDFYTNQHIDAFNYVELLLKLNKTETFAKICNDLVKDFDKIKDKDLRLLIKDRFDAFEKTRKIRNEFKTQFKVNYRNFKLIDKEYWYGKYNITASELNAYGVKAVMNFDVLRLNKETLEPEWYLGYNYLQHNDPCYHYDCYTIDNKLDLSLHKFYRPLTTLKQYKHAQNVSKDLVLGFNNIIKKHKNLIVTKSLKDVIILNKINIPAISFTSEISLPSDEVLYKIKKKCNNLIFFYDNDEVGIKNGKEKAKKLNGKYMFLPKEETLVNVKDVSDYYEQLLLNDENKALETLEQKINTLILNAKK